MEQPQTEDYEVLEPVYHDQVEAKPMLDTTIAKERERIFAPGKAQGEREGWTKGKMEGEVEGSLKGKAELLISLLERRFSPLTFVQKQYLYELDAAGLLILAEKLWHAQSLQEIWDEDKGWQ